MNVNDWAEAVGEALGRGVARGIHVGLAPVPVATPVVARRGPGRPRKNAVVVAPVAPKVVAAKTPAKTSCKWPDCSNAPRSRGYCSRHYQAARRAGKI
jgi:hypothetical protein